MAARSTAKGPITTLLRRAREALKERFRIARLRPGQQSVIERVLAGQPTLAIMPTGAGKSLCYQLPAVLLPGRTVVVSPLIALMKDQVESLQALGIAAVQLNSALGSEENAASEAAIADGSARIVMTTPERLADPDFVALLTQHPVSLLVVDEAHCISQWGHDFRPAFLEIGALVPRLGKPNVLALTATASDEVASDVCKQLGIPRDGVLNTGSYRPNLDLRVEQVAREEDKLARAVAIVRNTEGPGVVYAATIKAAQAVYDALVAAEESVGLYHGKLPAAQRAAMQEAFMGGTTRVMVATNAFGLGIDKPDIRFVLHYQLPPNPEAYYQEAGRAGRDRQHATCTLLFLRHDKAIQQFFMAGRYPTEEDALALYHALQEPPPDGDAWTLPLLQSRLARPRSKLQVALGLLRKDRIVAQDAQGRLKLAKRELAGDVFGRMMDAYGRKRDADRAALEKMVFYAQTGQCRWRVLLEHLEGESPFERCCHCDNCGRIAAHEKVIEQLAREAPAADAPHEEDEDATAFARGDIVRVKRYGRGVVEEANGTQVTVAFADGSRRSFLPDYVERYKKQSGPRSPRAASGPVSLEKPALAEPAGA